MRRSVSVLAHWNPRTDRWDIASQEESQRRHSKGQSKAIARNGRATCASLAHQRQESSQLEETTDCMKPSTSSLVPLNTCESGSWILEQCSWNSDSRPCWQQNTVAIPSTGKLSVTVCNVITFNDNVYDEILNMETRICSRRTIVRLNVSLSKTVVVDLKWVERRDFFI